MKKILFILETALTFSVIGGFQLITFNSIAQTPNWLWAKSGCGISADIGISICTDKKNNCYAAGSFEGTFMIFESDTLSVSSNYNEHMFVVKYDSTGNIVWIKSASGNNNSYCSSVKTDTNGNLFISGWFNSSDTIIFGNDTLLRTDYGPALFIVKYDSLGNVIWAKTAIGSLVTNYGGPVISIDRYGNVYVTGVFDANIIPSPSTITFGNTTLTGVGGTDIFIVKYNSLGNVIWAKSAGGAGGDFCTGISTDTNGNSFLTGYFYDYPIVFDTISLTNNGTNIFVVKYDSNGNVHWAKSNTSGSAYSKSISNDANGNSYITGYFNSIDAVFDNITIQNYGYENIFIAKLDSLGNFIWVKSEGGPRANEAHGIITDIYGNSYITGFFQDMIILGSTPLISIGASDIFISKYDSSGNVLWAQKAGGVNNETGNSIDIDVIGNSYITGYFSSTLANFGSINLNNIDTNNFSDAFVAKLNYKSLGIDEYNYKFNNINIYPNPSNSSFTLSVPPATKQVQILNSLGQILQSAIIDRQTSLNFEIVKSGIYFIQITTDKETVTKKLIVVN